MGGGRAGAFALGLVERCGGGRTVVMVVMVVVDESGGVREGM